MTTIATTTPTIIIVGDDDDDDVGDDVGDEDGDDDNNDDEDGDDDNNDDEDGVVWSVTEEVIWLVIQSSKVNESSIVGQPESMSRVTPFTLTDGSICTHWLILVTISLASVIEAGTCKVIIARYTTVFVNSPWDPRQLKLSSMILLAVNVHEQYIDTCRTISSLMSLRFWSMSMFCI